MIADALCSYMHPDLPFAQQPAEMQSAYVKGRPRSRARSSRRRSQPQEDTPNNPRKGNMQDLRPGERVMLPPYLGHTIATVMFTDLPLPQDPGHHRPFLLGGQRMAVVQAVGHDGRPRLIMVEWRDLRPIPTISGPPG